MTFLSDECKPSVIVYWKNNKWNKARQVFSSEHDITQWYKHNRWRVDGLSVVMTVEEFQKAQQEGRL